ncbi:MULTISPECIES: LuxR C-terminal-related transcriptional regulator [Lentzea]|uniref:Homeodomain-like domain-containing protein n=1 Tax=Lentzea albida TaxID=65499 RepID=A0A1H9MS84_9PSEU|nr:MULTISPECIES: LuxR C-terminal-related transcriptional regulator [Lentzea]USX54735.1 LuxR C-terminal-related transcriptional regulator [Lentzea sp. HUAS12]SER26347.1 Homeodomain-like domain-containing protein [Lentzea albida]
MAVTRTTLGVASVPAPRPSADHAVSVGSEPTVATQHLLRLMRTGATDRAIARELDVSLRTLNRRIARLQSMLGVQSRFQLGVLAAELEWLAVE